MLRDGFSLAIFLLLALNFFALFLNFGTNDSQNALYFLDAGQDESEIFETDGVKAVIDAGSTQTEFDKLLHGKYADIGIITGPQTNYGKNWGSLIKKFDFGAILWSGREDTNSADWKNLKKGIVSEKIPLIQASAKDVVHIGNSEIKVVSPYASNLKSGVLEDTSMVLSVNFSGTEALIAGNVGPNIESELVKHGLDEADILKVPGHAAKNSASKSFLNSVKPKISVISTGPKTLPSLDALARLKSAGSLVFQTGLSGTVKIAPKDGKLEVFTEK